MSFINMSINEFLQELASGAPTPGGGSVAALCGGLASALCSMVARATHGKEKYRSAWVEMETIMQHGDRLRDCFLELADEDANAYNQVVAAMRLPKTTEEEKTRRGEALQKANRKATEVPLKTATLMVEIAHWLKQIADKGNPNCISDAGTAAELIRAAAYAASFNVRFNLAGVNNEKFAEYCRLQLDQTLVEIDAAVAQLEKKVVAAMK